MHTTSHRIVAVKTAEPHAHVVEVVTAGCAAMTVIAESGEGEDVLLRLAGPE